MAQDNELQLALKIEADNSIDNAAKKLDNVADAYDNVSDAAKKASKETEETKKEVDSLTAALSKVLREEGLSDLATNAAKAAREGKELDEVIQGLRAGLEDFGANDKEVEKIIRQFERLRKVTDDIKPPDVVPDFDPRKTQLDFAGTSGDKASIAGQARGGLDALTGGNAGALGQALEGAEAVFDLGEAAGKLGGPVGKAVTALGPAGLAGVAAGAGVALVALNIVMAEWKKRAEEAKKVQEALNNTLLELAQLEVEGATTEDIAQKGEDLQTALESAELGLELLTKQYENQFETLGPLEEFWSRLTEAREAQLVRDIEAQETVIAEAEASVQVHTEYVASLEETQIAANDAAAAERELAAERTQQVLTDAAQAGELAATRERLKDATQEQIDAELQSIEIKRIDAQTTLDSLKASGDTSEETQARIDALTETLSFLGEQSAQLNNLRKNAKTDKQVQAERELAQAREETAKASAKAAASESSSSRFARRRADSARFQTSSFSFADVFGLGGATDKPDTSDIEKQWIDLQNDIIKVNNDFSERRIQQIIDFNRREMDIARSFGDQRADNLEEGNFLALDKLNTEEERAFRDQSIDRKRALQDANRDQQNALRDLRNQEQKFQQQRLQISQQGFQSALNQQQQFMNAFVGNFSRMFSALSGRVRSPVTS